MTKLMTMLRLALVVLPVVFVAGCGSMTGDDGSVAALDNTYERPNQ